MISKKMFLMLTLAAVPSFVALASAQEAVCCPAPIGPMPPGHMGMMPPPPSPFMGMLPGVELTKEQREKLHNLFHAHRKARHDAMHQRHEIDRQISRLLLASGPIDKAKFDALIKQKEALNAQDEEAMAADVLAIHDVLTPEQLTKARATQEKLDALEGQIRDLLHPPHDKDKSGKDNAEKDGDDTP